MNAAQHDGTGADADSSAAASLRQLPCALRLTAGSLYGIAAGLLLQDDVRVAAIAMVVIWLATLWPQAGDQGVIYARTPLE